MKRRRRDIVDRLADNWEARTAEGGRRYYVNHHTQTSQWIPPQESWTSTDTNHGNRLPYGWEAGLDKEGKQYYINHVDKSTSREDPRDDPDYVEAPRPRKIQLSRDDQLGFGFVAGSEKPVIVRFVTEGGPSEDLLMPDDQILKINDEDVEKAPRERVIELVRSCTDSISLTVCQPHTDNSARRSALLTAAKKARLKNNPSRVRFAESVIVNGSAVISPSIHESYIPFMPNVLKVFLENGQTKSFKYDNKTTVKEVIDSLQEKLSITAVNHFALVLQNLKGNAHKLTILQELETLTDIAARPDSSHFKCLFRLAFVPKDAYDLLQADNIAFDYFFTQCTNDVVQERFSSELKYDVALRLAALHIQQHYSASHNAAKLSLKNLERETGLDSFVPTSILQSMKLKEIRKCLAHYMKVNQSLAPGQKQLTELQAKLHYLKILGHLKAFGGKCFIATFVEKKTEVMIVVGPTRGIAEATNIKTNTFQTLSTFEEINSITLTKENDSMQQVLLHLQDTAYIPEVTLSMLNEDIEEFLALVEGYYRLFVDAHRSLLTGDHTRNNNTDSQLVPYSGTHNVVPAAWSYVNGGKSATSGEPVEPESRVAEVRETSPDETIPKVVDLGKGPPPYSQDSKAENEPADEKDIPPVQKPADLPVEGVSLTTAAPLASPDASTLSGSSDSSIQQPNTDSQVPDAPSPERRDSPVSHEDVSTDSDSVTSSSVSTVVQAQNDPDSCASPQEGATDQKPPMSRSMSAQDSRFGVASFKTFASSPKSSPVLRRAQMGQENASGEEGSRGSDDVSVHSGMESDGDPEPEKHTKLDTGRDSPTHKVQDVQSESDVDTPVASPTEIKAESELLHGPAQEDTERPQSFGAQTSEQLPGSEDQFKELACSFGLHSPEGVPLVEQIHPSYNPRLFSDGALYLDPDIIDLTLIPPPKTPEDPQGLIDFTSPTATIPPPGFPGDDSATSPQEAAGGLSPGSANLPPSFMDLPSPIRHKMDSMIQNDEDLGNQLVVMEALLTAERHRDDTEKESGIFESESDSGNETISSENVEFSSVLGPSSASANRAPSSAVDTFDIDAFIASMVVPPPPKDDTDQVQPSTAPPSTKSDALFGLLGLRSNFEQDLPHSAPSGSVGQSETHSSVPSFRDAHQISSEKLSTYTEDKLISQLLSGRDMDLEDEISKLVIPPPPTETALAEIPVVPPVDRGDTDGLQKDTLSVETSNDISPFDSPTALEGTKLVDTLRAEYETKYGKSELKAPASNVAHQRSSSVPDDRVTDFEGSASDNPGPMALSYKRTLWRPTEVKSADSSPLHHPTVAMGNVPSTLPRILRKKKPPPPPPPRRSSMPPVSHGDEIFLVPEDASIVDSQYKQVVHQRSLSVPDDSVQRPKSNSFHQTRDSSPSYSTFGTRHSLGAHNYQNVFKNQSSIRNIENVIVPTISEGDPHLSRKLLTEQTASRSGHLHPGGVPSKAATIERDNSVIPSTFTPGRANVASRSVTLDRGDGQNLHTMLDVSRSADAINLQAYKEYKRSSSSSSSDSSRSGSNDSSRFQAFKSKLKSYVAPSIYKKQLIFSRGSPKDRDREDSEPRKSDYLSAGLSLPSPSHSPSAAPPKSPSSPRHSPLVHRHSSFSDHSDSGGSPKTFRTFLGERPRLSSGSESAPTSPLKTAGIRTSYPVVKSDLHGLTTDQATGSPKKVLSPCVSLPIALSPSTSSKHRSTPPQNHRQPLLLGSTQEAAVIPKGRVLIKQASGDGLPTLNGDQNGQHGDTQEGHSVRVGALKSELKAKFEQIPDESAVGISDAHVIDLTLETVAKEVLRKEYCGEETFKEADLDVDTMIVLLDRLARDSVGSTQTMDSDAFRRLKESLVSQSRTFVTESKLLVSSATQSRERLVEKVNSSMHTLARIMDKTQQLIGIMTSQAQIEVFSTKVRDVAKAYKSTTTTAHNAAGKPLSDPNMKHLMKQATSLAAILSTFMKTLKSLDSG